jgi:hypothetical protein
LSSTSSTVGEESQLHLVHLLLLFLLHLYMPHAQPERLTLINEHQQPTRLQHGEQRICRVGPPCAPPWRTDMYGKGPVHPALAGTGIAPHDEQPVVAGCQVRERHVKVAHLHPPAITVLKAV